MKNKTMRLYLFFLSLFFFPFSIHASSGIIELTDGWQIKWEEEETWRDLKSLKNIKEAASLLEILVMGNKKQFDLNLRNDLPYMDSIENQFLLISGVYGSFSVYIGERKVYEFVGSDILSPKFYYPYYFHQISLKESHQNSKLTIAIHSEYFRGGVQGEIKTGKAEELKAQILERDLDRMVVACIVFILSFFSLFWLFKTKKNLYLVASLFFFFAGMLVVNFTHIKQFWFDNPEFWSYSIYYSFLTSISFFSLNEKLLNDHLLLRRIWQVQVLYTVFCLFSQGSIPFYLTAMGLFVFVLAGMIVLFFVIVTNWKKNRMAKRLGIGLIVFILFVFYDLLVQLGIGPWERSLGHWGLFFLLFFISWALFKKEKEEPQP